MNQALVVLFTVGGLFSLLGVLVMLLRKNLVVMLLGLEMVTLGAFMALAGAGRVCLEESTLGEGAALSLVALGVAACEVALGLALVFKLHVSGRSPDVEELDVHE